MAAPQSAGEQFTNILHTRAEGHTDPCNNKIPTDGPFVVVVTGAGKGIGYNICLAYARAGVTGLVVCSRTQSDLDSLCREASIINPELEILCQICDTSKEEDVKALAQATKQKFGGRLDVVVANAGTCSRLINDDGDGSGRRLPQGFMEDEDFAKVTQVNYLGSYYTAHSFIPLLLAPSNESSVRAFVYINSGTAHCIDSQICPASYNASKFANSRLIEMMANDHGAAGLQAFSVHPGEVLTALTERLSLKKGDLWDQILRIDVGLCGGFLTWLTHERREWLSGRFISVQWDVEQLCEKKDEIVRGDKLKFRMVL